MTNIAVVYSSATGNVAAMAHALAEGAKETGAEVRVRRVAETAPAEAIAANPTWQAFLDTCPDDIATLDDLAWADGIALGTPTRFGGPTSQMKSFLDTTGGLWFSNALVNKAVTSFTSSSTQHGGLESTILAINNHAYHWGAVIVPLGYGDKHVARVTGNPYGASWVSRGGAAPDADCIEACRIQGRRLAEISTRLAKGES
jgi:NAD(P)H dehydrogenase (quinone)